MDRQDDDEDEIDKGCGWLERDKSKQGRTGQSEGAVETSYSEFSLSSLAPVCGAQWDSYFLLHLGSYPRECTSRDHSGYCGYASFMPPDASVDYGGSSLIGRNIQH